MRQTVAAFCIACLAALGLAIVPAIADTVPLASTDFEGDWAIDGQAPIKLRYNASRSTVRVDVSNAGGRVVMLGNIKTGEMLNWSPDLPGVAMRMHTAPLQARDASRTGETRTVQGESCTVWRGEGVNVCFTSDGIWIDADRAGKSARIHNLARKSQPADLFAPPAGATILDMSADMAGSMGMALPGGTLSPF